MTNFVLSFSEIEKKLKIKSKKTPQELFKKAVRKISQHTAKGEFGELILFTLLEAYFDAPKILSKIATKSSSKVFVHGADAVHAQYVEDSLRLYLGESKLHASFSGASTKAVKSISKTKDNYETEFDLIDSSIDFPGMDIETQEEMIDLLNPFSDHNQDSIDRLHLPCFIGFVETSVFDDDEKTYIEQYTELAGEHIQTFYEKLEKKGNDINKTALFLLPFSSIDTLTEEFIVHMGIKK